MCAATLGTCCKFSLATQILSGKLLSTDHNKDIEINVVPSCCEMLYTTHQFDKIFK